MSRSCIDAERASTVGTSAVETGTVETSAVVRAAANNGVESAVQATGAVEPGGESAPEARIVEFDARHYRDVMGAFPSGVTIITTLGPDGEPVGFTCQSFYSVSIDPPLISFSIARTSRSLAAVRGHGRVVVNFLSREQQHLSAQFARSGTDKWQGVDWTPAESNGVPVIDGVTGWVAGDIEREIEAGDHLIYLVRVDGLQTHLDREPLVFHRGSYRELEYMI